MNTSLEQPLAGRRTLVTGGSRGIGAAIVRRLAAEGSAVTFTYASSTAEAERLAAEESENGRSVAAIRADMANPNDAAAAVERAVGEMGGLDVLVNNAAIGHAAPIEAFSDDQYDSLVATNIGGVFFTIRSAVAHLGEGSRIINIGSVNADRVPSPGLSVYAMTKGAVSALTRGLARELGPRGITVNNVQPVGIATDMNPEEGEHADEARLVIALGRYGHCHDVAAVVSFLAGHDSGFVTGANWNVDGGYTA